MSEGFQCQSWLKDQSRPCGNPARRRSKWCTSHKYTSYQAPGLASGDEYTDGEEEEEEELFVLTDGETDSSTDDDLGSAMASFKNALKEANSNTDDDEDDELASDISASQHSLAKRGTKAKDLARHSRKSSNRPVASNKKVSWKRTGGGEAPDRLGTSVAHATKTLKAAFLSRFKELERLASELEKLEL